jgi:uncharacterized iron-regulated membrane protein
VDPGDQGVHHDDEYFVDPYTGAVLGSRAWGDLSQGRKNIVPFIYRLHDNLALGEMGHVLFGIVAVLWTLDCFVGAYLTFPIRSPKKQEIQSKRMLGLASPGRWLGRWSRAWLLKVSKLASLVFTWHRASGLWVWGMLLMFAWSGVALTFYGEVYKPVMSAFVSMDESGFEAVQANKKDRPIPALTWSEALIRGQTLLSEQAEQEGFEVIEPERLRYFEHLGHFQYRAKSSLDIMTHYAQTGVWFDGDSGEYRALDVPTGKNAGVTATTSLYALHFGNWATGGLAYRIFVCVCGVLVGLLSVTGVWIWWRKWKQRVALSRKASQAPARAFQSPSELSLPACRSSRSSA